VDETASPAGAPLSLYRTRVRPEWLDYNGHMSEAFYVLVFGYTTDALLDEIGMDAARRELSHTSVYTLEGHICYLAEVRADEHLRVTTQVLDLDHKRARIFHEMFRGEGDERVATEELLLCNVDTRASRSAPFAEDVAGALRSFRDAHRDLPVDERVGRAIRLPEGR
jgi:acyl-CoA thioester hydrolase